MTPSVFGKPKGKKPRFIGSSNYPTSTLMEHALSNSRPLKQLKRFKVAQCPHCGHIAVTEAESRLTCLSCKKSASFRLGGRWAVKLFQTNYFDVALEFCKHWKKMNAEGTFGMREVITTFINQN